MYFCAGLVIYWSDRVMSVFQVGDWNDLYIHTSRRDVKPTIYK